MIRVKRGISVELTAVVVFVGLAALLTADLAMAACERACKKYDCHGWISSQGTEYCYKFDELPTAEILWHCKHCDGGMKFGPLSMVTTNKFHAVN
jgi:hypothetical protein